MPQLIRELERCRIRPRVKSAAAEIFGAAANSPVPPWSAGSPMKNLARCFVLESVRALPEETVALPSSRTISNAFARLGSPHLAEVPPDQDALEFEIDFPRRPAGYFDHTPARGRRSHCPVSAEIWRKHPANRASREDCGCGSANSSHSRFGVAPMFPATRAGANGTRVNFFLVPLPRARRCSSNSWKRQHARTPVLNSLGFDRRAVARYSPLDLHAA